MAIKYAQQAAKLRDIPSQQQAWLKLRQGWSLSMVRGKEKEARNVLDDVRHFLADAPCDDQQIRDNADLMGSVGRAFYDLGDYREAQTCLDEAVQRLGGSAPRYHGIFLARQVAASLRASEPEFAADRMLTLARIVPLVNSVQLDNFVRDVLAASYLWRKVPEVRAARAQLRAVWAGESTLA
jgi:tetratricopeptide (TPR) repeat protein